MDPKREPVTERLKRMGRSTLVGIVATLVDQIVFQACKRLPVFHTGLLHVTHWMERGTFGHHAFHPDDLGKTLAVIGGTTVQFLGNRHFAFRAGHGRLSKQMKRFVVAEMTAFVLTILVFHLLATYLPLPSDIASLASGSIVYFGFSYPIWKRVFDVAPHEPRTPRAAVHSPRAVGLDRAA